jgi:hypothetical protein
MAYWVYEQGLKLCHDINMHNLFIQKEVMLGGVFNEGLIILYFKFES